MNTEMKTEIINTVVLQQEEEETCKDCVIDILFWSYCGGVGSKRLCDKCFEKEHDEKEEEETCEDCVVWEDCGIQKKCLCDKCFEKENPEEWEEHLESEKAMEDAREGDEANGVKYGADLEEDPLPICKECDLSLFNRLIHRQDDAFCSCYSLPEFDEDGISW